MMLMVTLLMMFVTPDTPVADLLQIHRHLGRVHCPVESHHSSNLLMCGFTNNFFLGFFSTLTRTSLDISTTTTTVLHYLIILPSVHLNFVTFIAKFSKSAYYIVMGDNNQSSPFQCSSPRPLQSFKLTTCEHISPRCTATTLPYSLCSSCLKRTPQVGHILE